LVENNWHPDYWRSETGQRKGARFRNRIEHPETEFDVMESSTESETHETVLEIVEVILRVESLGDGLNNVIIV
jgi:hypothetical protein